jgi:hypothetical protein
VFIEGDGLMDVAQVETVGFGRVRLNRDASMPEVLINGGTVGGTGTLTVTDRLLWTSGSMTDGGTTIIAANATMTVDGSGIGVSGSAIHDGGRTIENFGTVELVRGNINASGSHPLTVHNRPDALFDIRINANNYLGNTGSTFSNEGTLRKSPGNGNSRLQMRLDNAGEIEIFSGGGVTVTSNATQTGGTTRVDDTTLEVSQGLTLKGGVLLGDGTVEGDVTQSGGASVPASRPES